MSATSVHLSELIDLAGSVATVAAAEDTGLIRSLGRPAPPGEHARRLGLDAGAVELVLDTLVALGVAERRGAHVGLSPAVQSSAGGPLGDLLPMGELWDHLPALLRTGRRYAHMDGPVTTRATEYQTAVVALGRLFDEAARDLAARLPAVHGRILDIGAGSGVWSLAMCARAGDGARVTALDLPAVLPAFSDRARAQGLDNRVDTLAGDYHTVELPTATFERVVLANVLHLEVPTDAAALIARAARSLAPGGDLIVIYCLDAGDSRRDVARAVYALHLAMRTDHGRVHLRQDIEQWAIAAGLSIGALHAPAAPPWNVAALVFHTARRASGGGAVG